MRGVMIFLLNAFKFFSGHVDIHWLCCHQGHIGKAMWMFRVCDASWCHVGVCRSSCIWGPCLGLWSYYARWLGDYTVCVLFYCCWSCWYKWPMLPPDVMSMALACTNTEGMNVQRTVLKSVVYAATIDHAEVCGMYWSGDHVKVYDPCFCWL